MSILKRLLKLSDAASEEAVSEQVQAVITERDALKVENEALKSSNRALTDRIALVDAEQKRVNDAEAVTLVDAAIKDGRLNGANRQAWLDDFGKDFAGAKVRLGSIPIRRAVASQIEKGAGVGKGSAQLADMTFQEILKADRLKELKGNRDLYAEKFREAYGHEPE
jgi:hypothetical protein